MQHINADPNVDAIIIKDAQIRYLDNLLFSNLALTLPVKQWTCLLGPSGVGKSSLLRLIAGLPVGAKADATIQTLHQLSVKNDVAYMAQTDLLLPWLTAIDNVMISLKLAGKKIHPAEKDRAMQLLQAVGLSSAIHKTPKQLSGGMRQRVALARTLFMDKPIVLMDEPFASVDAITKWRLQEYAVQMFSNKTVLLVTHDPLEALRLAHRIHVLAGTPAVLDQPLLLHSKTPRAFDDPQLVFMHQELLARLQQAQACND